MSWQNFFSWTFKAIAILLMISGFAISIFFSTSVLEYNRKLRISYTLFGLMAVALAISVIISDPGLWLTILCLIPILLAASAIGYYLQAHVFSYTVAEHRKRRDALNRFFHLFKKSK